MKITNPITLDVSIRNDYICLLGKQYDQNSRYLKITVANQGVKMDVPASATAVLHATRPDGLSAAIAGVVNSDGTVEVEIDDYILEIPGDVWLSLEISKDGETLKTLKCRLFVERADGDGWILVYKASSSLSAGTYHIDIVGTSYQFTTTSSVSARGSIYFASQGGLAQTRNSSGTIIESDITVTYGSGGTALTSDIPTMSFLSGLAEEIEDKFDDLSADIAETLSGYDDRITEVEGDMETLEGEVDDAISTITHKANDAGDYPLLYAGTSGQLVSSKGESQTTSFLIEAPGRENGEVVANVGVNMQAKKKLGNTVCVNQLVSFADETISVAGITVTKSGGKVTLYGMANDTVNTNLCTIPIVGGRNYIVRAVGAKQPIASGNYSAFLQLYGASVADLIINNDQTTDAIYGSATGTGTATLRIRIQSGVVYDTTFTPCVHDMDIWYGSPSAIPSAVATHPEDFGRYYAGSLDYNAGTLESADGTVLKSIGRNVFDKSTYTDAHNYIDISGLIINQTYHIMAENTSGLIQYKIATASYVTAVWSSGSISGVTFTVTQEIKDTGKLWVINSSYAAASVAQIEAAKVCLSLYYSGESGYDQYYPHSVLAEVDTGSEVLRSAGSVADEKTPDGTITRNVGAPVTLNLSTMTFTQEAGGGTKRWYSSTQPFSSYKKPASNFDKANAQSSQFACLVYQNLDSNSGFGITSTGRLGISNDIYTNRASYTSVEFFCEAATPTTEQGTPFAENIPCDDFGSLSWTQTKGIPQGIEIFYPIDLKGKLENSADNPSSNGSYALQTTSSGNSYVKLSTVIYATDANDDGNIVLMVIS